MGTDTREAVEALPSLHAIKVHRSMCIELMKLVDRISKIVPELEATRPRCSSGLQALCTLNQALEKANLLLRHCSESSKLYLAITGNATVSRCERSRNLLDQSLTEIQNNVPVILAAEISRIIDDVRSATFVLDSSEEEVGKAVLALLHRDTSLSDIGGKSEIEILQDAATRLQIDSPKALLIEKRSIKKMLDKVTDDEQAKKKNIYIYLLHLLKKHGKTMIGNQAEHVSTQHEESFISTNSRDNYQYGESVVLEYRKHSREDVAQAGMLSTSTPPEEFKCPISLKLMFDPVVIASGQTFERMWIQKWFDDGHCTCPKTKKRLVHFYLTPNTSMKDLISKWCMDNGVTIPDPRMQLTPARTWETSSTSIASFGSSMDTIKLPIDISNVSFGSLDCSYGSDLSNFKVVDGFNLIPLPNDNSHGFQSYANTHEMDQKFLSGLALIPWESQKKMVEDVENHLKYNYNNEACHSISSENFVEPLIRFLEDARVLHDVDAQKSGSQLLLTFVSKRRNAITFLCDNAFTLLTSLLDSSITGEVLSIMVVLSSHKICRAKIAGSGALSSIIRILNTQTLEYQDSAIKILYNMVLDSESRSLLLSFECVPKLIHFLDHDSLAKYSIAILKHLCDYEKARISIAESAGCIASIAELLETGSHVDQENALSILLSLCTQRSQYCKIVMEEGVIPALCNISVNGSDKGKAGATELLRTLRDITYSGAHEQPERELDDSNDSSYCLKENAASKTSGFWRKFTRTPKKKK